ncbi:MFS transporter [Blastococcus sp. TF02-8]|nr:MFS transporter [Blastococcus sp. TF02-8]
MLWVGETASAIGTQVTKLAVPLVAVLTLDVSTFQVSLLTAAGWLPWLLIGLPAGAWVDRLPRRPLMVVCDLAAVGLLVTVPLAAWLGALTYVHLLGVELLVGVATVFLQTSFQVLLPGIVDAEHLPEANAKVQGSEAAAFVAGPGIAGLLSHAVGAVQGLLVDAAGFLVSAGTLLRIRTPERIGTPVAPRRALRSEIREGFAFLVRDPYLRVLVAGGAVTNVALTGYQAILVVFLVREVGVDAATAGLLIAGMSVGGLIGAAVATAGARRFGSARFTLTAAFTMGPFALLLPLTAPGWRLALVLIGGVGVGIGVAVGNVLRGSFRQAYTPRAILGRVVVSMQFLNLGAIPLGALVGGSLGMALGLRPTMWVMATALALAPFVLLLGPLKRARDFPVAPVTAPVSAA